MIMHPEIKKFWENCGYTIRSSNYCNGTWHTVYYAVLTYNGITREHCIANAGKYFFERKD